MTAGLLLPPLLAILAVLLVASERRSRRQLLTLGAPTQTRRRLLPDLCALTALALLIWPQEVGPAPAAHSAESATLALVVDVSASMAAADPPPTRLDRAKREMRRLIEGMPQVRFTLLAFAGEAIRQVPPTADRETVLFFVEHLAPGLVASPGSAPEEAAIAAQQFLREDPGERAVVLFSDGERTFPGRAPDPAADIPVFIVPLGSPAGAPVPDADGRPRRDEAGRIVLSLPDHARLQRLADATGGEMLNTAGSTAAVTPLLTRWARGTAAPGAAAMEILLILALGLLLLRQAPFASGRRREGTALLAAVFLIFAACRTPEVKAGHDLFRQAERAGRNGEREEAGRLFAEAAQLLEGEEQAAALYNVGTLLLLAGQARQAISPLEQALLLLPGDAEVRRNLALALRAAGRGSLPGVEDGEGQPDGGKETGMSRQQALQLLESVRPASEALAPPRARVQETVVRRDW